jgi:hypothetical protein
MEQLITEKEENDPLVYCMSWGATDILKIGFGQILALPFIP